MTGAPRPPLSQHFLHDRRIAGRIAGAVRAPAGAPVLEVGPGGGALTEHLLGRGWRVTAVELDARLAADLEARWGARPDFAVIRGDALRFELPRVPPGTPPWHVVGNLPYAITSPLLFHLLDQAATAPIEELVVMVQREVAERIAAPPGSRTFGALTVGIGLAADPSILFDVGPGSFRPPPRVRSAVVRLVPHDRWGLGEAGRQRVRRVVRRLFGQRRKQLQKSLRTLTPWRLDPGSVDRVGAASDIDLSRRPETLGLEEWIRLAEALEGPGGEDPDGEVVHTRGSGREG